METPDAPFLRTLRSHYGLTIAMTRGDIRRGRRLCEEAILRGPFEPHLYANLARLYLRAQRKDLAAQTVATALRLAPDDPQLANLARRIGLRREPIFSFLERSHPLNRLVGKAPPPPRDDLAAFLSRRATPGGGGNYSSK
ncbi:MAG: tetratricopeptide repeat protein [Acidobacteriota bacterium]|nr:tetratricopeptide repeat protein [Acidobacteriota bacterium]